ncbi:glycosyltransferase family 34 protein [Annulohypoxylon truncatum]|uniref:glycosyltransferase family 34 protein n=1 Tax=Annulohypoxylon truncatum TaxID=327061 RepID=UPI0020078DFE|nr:glycosyltransferase family 34 protein [Annulohypoxylon truncatum]KAI1210310.1 glycosyltransferase family 34 protein [Annulohypoxylon truncatum]
MHYAYPPRKSSNPPPYLPRSSRIPRIRRSHLRPIALFGLIIIGLIWLFSGSSKHTKHTISGKPAVVLVTVFDEGSDNSAYHKNIRENRMQYAEKHGYGTLLAKVGDYDLNGAPASWSKVVAMRHAITKYPDCKYMWYLDQNAFIMNPNLKVEDYVMSASKLEANMLKDLPVVPPDSIIKTFSHIKGSDIEFVMSQDKEGLASGSFVIKNGEWAKFFLDTWFDPLYRSYNFQKAETHALEHIVQWHPTILSKLAIIPQHIINAYNSNDHGAQYKDGDIAVVFAHCSDTGDKSCAKEAERFSQQWRTSFSRS